MATVGIFTRKPAIGTIFLDVIETRESTFEKEATSHPIETGEDISDYLITQIPSIAISGMMSNSIDQGGQSAGERARQTYDNLRQIYENDEFIDIQNEFELFTDMQIVSLIFSETKDIGVGSYRLEQERSKCPHKYPERRK